MTTITSKLHPPGDRRRHRPSRGLRPSRRHRHPLRRGRRRAAGRPAARLPGVLVRLAPADRTARAGGLARRRARPAWLQPLLAARRLRRLHGRQAGRGHPRPHPRARCRVRDGRRSRLGRNGRVDPGDEPPRGRRPPRHPQRRASAQAQRRPAQPAPAPAVLVLLLLPVPQAARAPCPPPALAILQAVPARRPPAVPRAGDRPLRPGVVPQAPRTAIIDYTSPPCDWPKQEFTHVTATPGHLGQGDRYSAASSRRQRTCPTSTGERLPNASHWVHHDEAERVNELLVDFLAPDRPH